MAKLTKVQTGQNVTVIFNEQKYTKRIADKEERQNFILKLSEIQEKLEKTSNNKVIEKLFNTVLNMFTSTSSNIEKNIKNEQIKVPNTGMNTPLLVRYNCRKPISAKIIIGV
jgi:uncharacterized protein YtpQ (UPF0354 family)